MFIQIIFFQYVYITFKKFLFNRRNMLQMEQWTMWPEQQLLPSERIHYVLNPVWKPASNLHLLETLCPVRAVDYE